MKSKSHTYNKKCSWGGSAKWSEEKTWDLVRRRLAMRSRKEGECIIYTGYKNTCGYGVIVIRGKVTGTHRAAYILKNGDIPEGMRILHSCDNRPCINTDHLRAGTPKENSDDMWKRGRNRNALAFKRRFAKRCIRGHRLSGANLYVRSDGRRNCKECLKHWKRHNRKKISETRTAQNRP